MASKQGHTNIVKILLGHAQIDINKAKNDGRTPLLVACVKGHVEVVRVLLQRADVDINAKTTKKNSINFVEAGATALSVASEKGHTEILELLKRTDEKDDSGCV